MGRGRRWTPWASAAGRSSGPALRALDGVGPAGVRRVGRLSHTGVARRLEAPVELPGLAQLVGRSPDADAEPGQKRGAEPGGLHDLGPLDGDPELVGLKPAQQVV